VENIPGHRDHHSGVPDQLITISLEWVITIVRNPDHDHLGMGDHDRPNHRSRSSGIPTLGSDDLYTASLRA
jgi:hypothetical protein